MRGLIRSGLTGRKSTVPDIIGHIDVGDESIGDNYKMLLTVLTVLVTYVFTLVSVANIQKFLSTSKFDH